MQLWVLIPLGAAAFIGLFFFLVLCYVVYGQERSTRRFPVHSDALVVLGMSSGRRKAEILRKRLELALQLYRIGAAKYIIVCGGRTGGQPPTEAVVMAVWLVRQGVPARYIIREGASRDTRENIINTTILMERLGFKTCAIVTSDFHLHRALSLAKHNKIQACGASASTPGFFLHLYFMLREVLGWCKLWFAKPLPPLPVVYEYDENSRINGAFSRVDDVR